METLARQTVRSRAMIDSIMAFCLIVTVVFDLVDIACIIVIAKRRKEREQHENHQSKL